MCFSSLDGAYSRIEASVQGRSLFLHDQQPASAQSNQSQLSLTSLSSV